jgi:ABC-type branched-subunit amino acid transport system ATPase component
MLEVGPLDAFYGDSHIIQTAFLQVAAGEGVALVGRNGAGKTTLLKSIMNAGPTVRGPVRCDGAELGSMAPFQRARLGFGLVPEDRRIYPHLTVVENIAMGGHSARADITPLGIDEVLEIFPILQNLRARHGFELSGGQQQMLAIARAVVARPRYLLLDEPTEGLAPVIVERLAEQINAIRAREGLALLLAEQNLWFARHCTSRLYLLDSGRTVFSGSWAEFDARPELMQSLSV